MIFLAEQGARESTTETAIKRVIAFQLAAAMAVERISKAELARRLETEPLAGRSSARSRQ